MPGIVKLPSSIEPVSSKQALVGQNFVETPAERVGKVEDFDISNWLSRFQKMANEIEISHPNGILNLGAKLENFIYDSKNEQVKLTVIN